MDTNIQVLSGSGGTETENLSCMSSDIYGLLTKGATMIITLLMKFLVWAWNYAPTESFIEICMIFACIETFVEIIVFIMWKDCTKI